jgi:membrane protein
MNPIQSVRRYIERLVSASHEELGRGQRALRFQVHLWRYMARRMKDLNVAAMSAALSFRTIFALVPLLVLAFLVLKSVGIVDENKQLLQKFLEEGGLSQIVYGQPSEPAAESGTAAETETAAAPPEQHRRREVTVAGVLQWAMKRAESQLTFGRLGPIGAILLIWTALSLLMTMEQSLNRLFEAPRSRSLPRRIIIYWSVITLGPLVLIAASYAGDKAFALAGDEPHLAWTLGILSWALSFILGAVFLGAVYALMPNTRVPWRAAVIGAAVALPLWLAARWGFSVYIHQVGTKSLYGALALVPLFLVWLNLSWMIFLGGAQLTFTLANRTRMERGDDSRRGVMGPWDLLAAAVAVAQENASSGKPVPAQAVARAAAMPEDGAVELLDMLASRGVLCRVAAGRSERTFVLARPAETIAVAGILDIGAGSSGQETTGWSAPIVRAVSAARQRAAAGLDNLTLASLLAA